MMWLLNGAKQMGFFTKKDTKDKRLNNTADLDDELDFDFSEFDDITEPETKNRKPVAKVASGIKEAVKSKAVDLLQILYSASFSSLIQTLLSVSESHRFGRTIGSRTMTAGRELHPALKN